MAAANKDKEALKRLLDKIFADRHVKSKSASTLDEIKLMK
jgi:hypothetical protein